MSFAIVFLGAGIGGAFRHGMTLAVAGLFGTRYPYATPIVNVLGSFLMGVVVGYFVSRTGLPQHLRLFLTTGVLGGFTTFSTFSLETALLHERGETAATAVYVLASVGLSVAALFAGLALARVSGRM